MSTVGGVLYCGMLSERASLLENSAYVLIVAGGVVFGIAFLGFCGACKSKKAFLYGVSKTSQGHTVTTNIYHYDIAHVANITYQAPAERVVTSRQ